MDRDDEVVLLSALQHYSYCPRQCGLIHLERVFDDNVYTAHASLAHQRVHSGEVSASAAGVRVARALPLWSDRLGLYGVADAVEFPEGGPPCPVEYKVGPRRASRHDDLQLCAQALCLEEMLGVSVPHGAVYSVKSRRRRSVDLDDCLRALTRETIEAVRGLLRGEALPSALEDARCPNCSLRDACLPGLSALSAGPEDLFRLSAEERLEVAGDA